MHTLCTVFCYSYNSNFSHVWEENMEMHQNIILLCYPLDLNPLFLLFYSILPTDWTACRHTNAAKFNFSKNNTVHIITKNLWILVSMKCCKRWWGHTHIHLYIHIWYITITMVIYSNRRTFVNRRVSEHILTIAHYNVTFLFDLGFVFRMMMPLFYSVLSFSM